MIILNLFVLGGYLLCVLFLPCQEFQYMIFVSGRDSAEGVGRLGHRSLGQTQLGHLGRQLVAELELKTPFSDGNLVGSYFNIL